MAQQVYKMQAILFDKRKHPVRETFYMLQDGDNIARNRALAYARYRAATLGLDAVVDHMRLTKFTGSDQNSIGRVEARLPSVYNSVTGMGGVSIPAVFDDRLQTLRRYLNPPAAVNPYLPEPSVNGLSSDQNANWAHDVAGTSLRVQMSRDGGGQVIDNFALIPDIVTTTLMDPTRFAGSDFEKGFAVWKAGVWRPFATHLQSLYVKSRKNTPKYRILQVISGGGSTNCVGNGILARVVVNRIPFEFPVTVPPVTPILAPTSGLRFQISGRRNKRRGGREREFNGMWEAYDGPAPNNIVTTGDQISIPIICTENLCADICRPNGYLTPVDYRLNRITAVDIIGSDQRRRRTLKF